MQIISIVLLLYLGLKGLITAGDFAFIFILSLTIIDQIWFLTENLDSCAEQIGVCNQALKILSQEHEQKTPKDVKPLQIDTGTIVFSRVIFIIRSHKNCLKTKLSL